MNDDDRAGSQRLYDLLYHGVDSFLCPATPIDSLERKGTKTRKCGQRICPEATD